MTKKTLAIILSSFIVIMPFLGFPVAVKTVFYVVTGLLLIILIELISIHGRRRVRMNTRRAERYDTKNREDSVEEVGGYDEKNDGDLTS